MRSSRLPARPLQRADIEDLHRSENIKTVVPLYIEYDDRIETFGVGIINQVAVKFLYFDRIGWRQFDKQDLDDPPLVHTSDPPNSSVSIVGTNALSVKELANDWGDILQSQWGIHFVSYGTPPDLANMNKSQNECSCSGIDSMTVDRVPITTETNGDFGYACTDCRTLYGIDFRGKKLELNRVTDEEWLFSEEIPGEITETGDDETYLLRTLGADIGRLERVVSALSFIGGARSHSFSLYDPQNHEALVHIEQGKVTGYLSWEEIDGLQVHRQLFVREQFRRQGVGSTLVQEWCNNYCTDGEYCVDDPNQESKSLLSNLGHRSPESEYQARHLYNLRSVGNEIDSGQILPR